MSSTAPASTPVSEAGLPQVRCLRSISTIVFDLDGTLVNTADSIASALNSALRLENIPAMPSSEVKLRIGYGGTALVEAALRNAGVRPDSDLIHRIQNTYLIEYARRPAWSSRPYPAATRILGRLRHLGLPLGVCTNKPYTQAMALLHALEIEQYFDCVVAADTCGFRKPDPRILLHALDELRGTPERSLHVGDTHLDVLTARAAGAFAAFVTFGFGTLLGAPLQPDVLIEDLMLLEDSLDRAGFFLARRATEPRRALARKRGGAIRAVRRGEEYGGNNADT
jgi:phosphoglycolate phosphatase